jgi:hypothetical protein
MAKGNMLLGHARGKVGSVVFSRAYGKQITRALAESVKNPRSDGQNVQRAIFATITGFTSAVRDVVDHSFQSTKEGQESVNRFVSINTKKLREAYLAGAPVDIMPKGAGLPYANAYRFSQGSLGLQNLFIGSQGTAGAQYFGVYQEEDWEGDVQDAAMLKACIPAFAPGCEIAVIKVYYNENEHFHYVTKDRAVFLSSFAGISANNIVSATGINELYLDMTKTTSKEVLKIIGGNSGNKILAVSENINEADNIGNKVVACVVIVSQKDTNGKWIYTTSDMMCVPAWNETHDTEAAVASYGNASAGESTSDLYLQQSASTAQEETQTPFNKMKKNIVFSGASDATDETDVSPYETNFLVDEGALSFELNVAKGGNEIGQVQAIYRGEEDGMFVKNKDGVLKYSVSKSGNTVVVRGTITPRPTNTSGKLAGWLDINIFAPQDVSGSNFTTIKFDPRT